MCSEVKKRTACSEEEDTLTRLQESAEGCESVFSPGVERNGEGNNSIIVAPRGRRGALG